MNCIELSVVGFIWYAECNSKLWRHAKEQFYPLGYFDGLCRRYGIANGIQTLSNGSYPGINVFQHKYVRYLLKTNTTVFIILCAFKQANLHLFSTGITIISKMRSYYF